MNTSLGISARVRALLASLLACALMAPLAAGCSKAGGGSDAGSGNGAMSAPATAPNGGPTYGSVPAPANAPAARKPGLSTTQKVAILAGTAALIYLYNKHKNAKGAGEQGQYYRSKNGRIYYRDEKGNAVWVTPPAQGIEVPADEAQRYNQAAQTGNFDVGSAPTATY